MALIEMKIGHIYSISFGENVRLIGRYQGSNCTDHYFFSQLHYWNGYENYYDGGCCVRGGITEIREATKCEKYSLMRLEIEINTL